eukprot:GEMP01013268.1.p1 GENE.GEMP01013268.1~~GEMP01013268.1.p1  ORF type:complete len:505 (+),score=69.24 GEMP01013268.1:130-1644(+)
MPPMELRRPCAPHPMYPRVKLAKVTDPLLIIRALKRVSNGDQMAEQKHVDVHFVYNAYVTYNHYAGLMWTQGYRDKAIQVLRKAMALPVANEWMSIILRGKSELNLAVFLSQGDDREECKEILANLSRRLVTYLESYGTTILRKRKSKEHVTDMDEMMLEEMVILTCFVLHREASLGFRCKSEVYEQCIQACDDYLHDKHPLRLLVELEHEATDATAPSSFARQDGLALLVDPMLTSTESSGWMPELAPICDDLGAVRGRQVSYRPSTAVSVSFRSENNRRRQRGDRPATATDTRVRCRTIRSESDVTKMQKVEEKRKMRQLQSKMSSETPPRQQGLSHMRKTIAKGDLGDDAPKRDNPFADFENSVVWLKTLARSPPDISHAKEEMKRKSREFWRMSRQMEAEDFEKLRTSQSSHLLVPSPNSSLTSVKRTLMHSHERLLRSNPGSFRKAFGTATIGLRLGGYLHPYGSSAKFGNQRAARFVFEHRKTGALSKKLSPNAPTTS